MYNECVGKTILFIDGENFIFKIEEALRNKGVQKDQIDIAQLNYNQIFQRALSGIKIAKKIFYVAKLHSHPETKEKSDDLIKTQRKLKNQLVRQRFDFVIAGNVRSQTIGNRVIFREKGVDVKIAVDLVSLACDKVIDTAVICSSDSDLQPAIKELRKRHIHIIYMGFEIDPNKGLAYTANQTILIRNKEITEAYLAVKKTKQKTNPPVL